VAELTIGCAMDCIIRKLLKNMVEAVGVESTVYCSFNKLQDSGWHKKHCKAS
jgi:hypothetical protein